MLNIRLNIVKLCYTALLAVSLFSFYIKDKGLTCKGIAKGLQRDCKGIAKGLQRDCKGLEEVYY